MILIVSLSRGTCGAVRYGMTWYCVIWRELVWYSVLCHGAQATKGHDQGCRLKKKKKQKSTRLPIVLVTCPCTCTYIPRDQEYTSNRLGDDKSRF